MLNLAILAAGIGLLSADAPASMPIAVFVVGAASAVIALLASKTQHDYYKNVRDLKNDLERRLELGDLALATTKGMGGVRGRLARVTTFQRLILAALLAADLVGLGAAVAQAVESGPTPRVEVVVQVVTEQGSPREIPMVFSRSGRIAASLTPRQGTLAAIRLVPGDYLVSSFARRLCRARVTVIAAPLQRVVVRCA